MGVLTKRSSLRCLAVAAMISTGFAAAQAETLTVGVAALPPSLEPGGASMQSINIKTQMMDGLVARDNSGKIVPGLAERWELANETTWRFHLRRGVTFHDGVELTAEDVKYTIERALDPNSAYGLIGRINGVSRVEVVDPYTVDVGSDRPWPALLVALADILIEPKHYGEKVGLEGQTRHPIGTGPFVFNNFVQGDRLELTANPAYWNGKPKVDNVVLRQIPDAATRVASLMAGETQFIEEVPVDLVEQIGSYPGTRIEALSSSVGLVLTYDVRQPPFDDPKVREAMDYAVDKPLILKEILKDQGEVLQGQLVTQSTFGFDPDTKARPYDPARAKELLAEAGYPDGFSTSIITQSGKYLSDVEITNAISGMLNEVGIKADVNVLEPGSFQKRLFSPDGLGPIYMIGWYSLGDADVALAWYTKQLRVTFWESDDFEHLFQEARTTNDATKRQELYAEIARLMHAENPSMFLFGLPTIYGASDKVTGIGAASDKILRLKDAELH